MIRHLDLSTEQATLLAAMQTAAARSQRDLEVCFSALVAGVGETQAKLVALEDTVLTVEVPDAE